MSEERYFVDDRCGCVAVRDRTKVDPEYPGLHGDEEDCVRFWMKRTEDTQCPTCKHVSAKYVADDHVLEAQNLCETLNKLWKAWPK